MDFVNKLTGSEKNKPVHTMDNTNPQSSTGNSGGGMMDKLHGMVGGGTQSEKNEDGLDKGAPPLPLSTNVLAHVLTRGITGVDWVQENVFKQGSQNNESALEQAKDEKISDMIRGGYKSGTGKEFPVADK